VRRRALLATAALLLPAGAALAAPAGLDAPNAVEISPKLVTSGQPTAAGLATLGAQGFGAVIYLAPPTVHDAVKEEPAILAAQGIAYVNLPIDFMQPDGRDYEAFAAAMAAHAGKKVLVHCQVNMRGSSMVFLHRVIAGKEDPDTAYQAVARVWSPSGAWKRFIVGTLRRHGVSFEPY
jgi:protein tyrosine phosphatase (PTP) superfamily phosphohydrolase (DUF442 family)